MSNFRKIVTYSIFLPVLFLQFSCDDTEDDSAVGALVGTWELSALTGTYIRDVAQPATTDPTSYSLTASWNYAAAIMGNDSAQADQTINAFLVGDTLLNTSSDASAAIAGGVVALTGVFNSSDVYTLSGTYPTLRLDEAACNTYQTVAQITDQGYYGVVYNSANTGGTFTITPDASLGDQVLPPFDDATVTFTNDGNTLNIQFEDRDSHDVDYAEVMSEWSESDDRVTMGISQVPIDPATGAFTATSDSLSSSGYLMSAALTYWGGYATFYYLTIAGEAAFLSLTGSITDDGDGNLLPEAIYHMTVNNAAGSTHSGLPYSVLVSSAGVPANDSAGDFDPTTPTTTAAGGKLTYNVNAVCIPVN
ncbi:uncharacterized protein METZ01_LOCUS281807, partial [marine metagenome]